MKRKDDFYLYDIGGESLLVPLGEQVMDLNGLVTLNETAVCVWEMLAEDRTVDELVDAVATQFDVDAVTARADVEVFLSEIAEMRLLAV